MAPSAVVPDELAVKVFQESLYVLEKAGNKPDLKEVCKNLGLSHETWRKKYPAMRKAYDAARGGATAEGAAEPAVAMATPKKAAAKAAGTPASKKRATPAKSTPRKKAKTSTPLSSARVEDDDLDDTVGTPGTPTATTRAKRATKAKPVYVEKGLGADSGSDLEDKTFKEEEDKKEEEEAANSEDTYP